MPWFDLKKLNEADEEQLKEINIPDNLKPNMKSFSFIFDLESHMFLYEYYYDGTTLTPKQVQLFLDHLLNDDALLDRFGSVDVTIVADREGLESVLSIHVLKRLTILIQRPNPADFGGLDRVIEERMSDQHAKKLRIEYEAIPGQSLEPDEETKEYALVATKNGEAIAAGRTEEGIAESRSTSDHPVIESDRYDPDVTSESNAFLGVASRLLGRLRRA